MVLGRGKTVMGKQSIQEGELQYTDSRANRVERRPVTCSYTVQPLHKDSLRQTVSYVPMKFSYIPLKKTLHNMDLL